MNKLKNYIIFLLLFIFILSCDVLLKKNEGEFDKNQNDYQYISLSGYSEGTFGFNQTKFINSIDKKYLYTYYTSGYSNIAVFNVDNINGHIYNMRQICSSMDRRYLAISPDNKFLYTSDTSYNINVYKIKENGNADLIQNFATSFNDISYIIVSPNNSFIYTLGTSGALNVIHCFKKNIEDGKISFLYSLDITNFSDKITFSPDFKFLYISSSSNLSLQWYEINNDGTLNYNGILSVLANDLCMSQDGKYIYAANGNFINIYKRYYSNGNLSLINSVSANTQIYSMIISPDQNYLYIVTDTGAADAYVEWFNINSKTGNLSNHNSLNIGSIILGPIYINSSSNGDYLFVFDSSNINIVIFKVNKN